MSSPITLRSNYRRLSARLFALAVVGALSACGFRLEGAGTLPPSMTRTYLQVTSRNSEFLSSLRSVLRLRGAVLVESPEAADSVLIVSADDTGQRVLSVSARNIPREYEIYYSVTVSLVAQNERLIESETIVVTRSYTYDVTQVLGKGAEEQILRQALADDLARQVMRRIESTATQTIVPAG